MKKTFRNIVKVLFFTTAMMMIAAGCENNPESGKESAEPYSYTVTFDSQNADKAASPSSITVTEPATTVSALPAAPEKAGYEFAGWFTKENGEGTEFTASTTVSENITVYAKWKEIIFTVNGTDGISITYKKSDKLLVQQYYIYNSKDVCVYNIYGEIPAAFNYKYLDTGATYTYRIFYKFNDEQKILDGSIKVEKGNGEFKTNDYATATFEKGVLKITNIKIPEIEGATLNNVNFSLNSGEGGWKKDYDWITTLWASKDEIDSGAMEGNVYDILFSKNKNPDDYDGKPLWINLVYSFKLDNVDYSINLLKNGYFAFTFENPEKDVVRDSAVPQDAYYVVFDANNLKAFPEKMEGPGWQFLKSLKHDEPYNKSMFMTPANNGTWATMNFTFDNALDVSGKTLYVVLKEKSTTTENFDSIDFRLVSDETHISNINLRPSDSEKYKVYELPVSNFNTLWSSDDSILSAELSVVKTMRICFLEFNNPLWIEAIYLK